MKVAGNTVLITGGASGIGLALATRFAKGGSNVIICGRRKDKLNEAKAANPSFVTRVCDVASETDRIALVEWVTREHPALNVLINNAGVQRRVKLTEWEKWDATQQELTINLGAPIHLSTLLIPHLAAQEESAIVNVTSGLSFSPLAVVPVYCATKAALHSFTLSLRHQLAPTSIKVIEFIPPAVDTDLGGVGLHKFGVPVAELADAMMAGFARGELEVAHAFAQESSQASREQLDAIFARMNAPR
jgi:uncharacterized oxidoreductase